MERGRNTLYNAIEDKLNKDCLIALFKTPKKEYSNNIKPGSKVIDFSTFSIDIRRDGGSFTASGWQ